MLQFCNLLFGIGTYPFKINCLLQRRLSSDLGVIVGNSNLMKGEEETGRKGISVKLVTATGPTGPNELNEDGGGLIDLTDGTQAQGTGGQPVDATGDKKK